jgi:CubicO group peptidase (beta-lactamase class C family)
LPFPLFFIGLAALALSACGDGPVEPEEAAEAIEVPEAAVPEPETPEPEPEPEPEAESEPPVYDFSAVSPIVANFVEENDLNGAGFVVVQRDDGVIYSDYWGEFDEDRISLIASSSKMITAGVLLRLDDDGLLDIDAPVAEVVDWGAANPDIIPAQLISNSSGLVGLLPNPAYAPYLCQYIPTGTLQSCGESIFTTTADDADIVSPDVEFRYGGAQWQVAGAVAEVASGKPWAQLIDEIYVQPCGLDVLAYSNPFTQIASGLTYPTDFDGDPAMLAATDNPNMEGGVYTTANDYAALLLMHLRDGMCGDTQVLSPEALDRMHSDRILEAYEGSTFTGSGYGMGWWVDRNSGRISDAGAYGSVPWLDLEDGYGAYLVVEADSITGNRLAGELYDVVEAAVRSR